MGWNGAAPMADRTFGSRVSPASVLLVLVLAQAGCLVLGLWLESRFLASAGTDDARLPMRALLFLWTTGLQAIVAYLVFAKLSAGTSQREIEAANESLRRHNDLIRTRDAVIFGLAKLAESRDPETGHHLERITLLATSLATALRRDPRYRDQVTPTFIKLIGISSALHDIGKVGIQDTILRNPGRLLEEERRVMQSHTRVVLESGNLPATAAAPKDHALVESA